MEPVDLDSFSGEGSRACGDGGIADDSERARRMLPGELWGLLRFAAAGLAGPPNAADRDTGLRLSTRARFEAGDAVGSGVSSGDGEGDALQGELEQSDPVERLRFNGETEPNAADSEMAPLRLGSFTERARKRGEARAGDGVADLDDKGSLASISSRRPNAAASDSFSTGMVPVRGSGRGRIIGHRPSYNVATYADLDLPRRCLAIVVPLLLDTFGCSLLYRLSFSAEENGKTSTLETFMGKLYLSVFYMVKSIIY